MSKSPVQKRKPLVSYPISPKPRLRPVPVSRIEATPTKNNIDLNIQPTNTTRKLPSDEKKREFAVNKSNSGG